VQLLGFLESEAAFSHMLVHHSQLFVLRLLQLADLLG
jgi:hypothetical protein